MFESSFFFPPCPLHDFTVIDDTGIRRNDIYHGEIIFSIDHPQISLYLSSHTYAHTRSNTMASFMPRYDH